jgi:acetylornithine/N-succinyldiaminopimelate aminotransferase
MPGVTVLPYNDVDALEAAMDETVAGIIVEVVQGEGGLEVMTPAFADALNRLRDRYDAVLIDDEVQAGLGRTGRLFAHELVELRPDVVTLSKPLAAGLPLSATLIPAKVNDLLHVGEHGTTFGGGPVTCAAACHVWDTVTAPGFLEAVEQRSGVLEQELASIANAYDSVTGLRGAGMLRGLALDIPEGLEADTMSKTLAEARSAGLLVLKSGANVLRVAPPLVISEDEIREGTGILRKVVEHLDSIL